MNPRASSFRFRVGRVERLWIRRRLGESTQSRALRRIDLYGVAFRLVICPLGLLLPIQSWGADAEEPRQAAQASCVSEDAFAGLDFCDSEEAVRRKVRETASLSCVEGSDCRILQVAIGDLEFRGHPSFARDGLYRFELSLKSYTAAHYETYVKHDWSRVVALVTETYGNPSGTGTFPSIDELSDATVSHTHEWNRDGKAVYVGVLKSGGEYTALAAFIDLARAEEAAVERALPPATPAAEARERLLLDVSFLYFINRNSGDSIAASYSPGGVLVVTGPRDVLLWLDIGSTWNVTDRLSLSAGLPLVAVQDFALFDEGKVRFGIGDARATAAGTLWHERSFLPSLTLRVEGSAPTAKLDGLGADLWRVAGGATLQKYLYGRFGIYGDGSYSHYFDRRGRKQERLISYGGGLLFGDSEGAITLGITEFDQGEVSKDGVLLFESARDLHATGGIGSELASFTVDIGGLRDRLSVTLVLSVSLPLF